MSALRTALDDYLRIRRRLGFTMPQDGRMLEGFVEHLDQAGAPRITTELALAWARLPVDVHPFTWRQRLTVARGFARYLATIDPTSEVPPVDLLPGHGPRIAPYVYSGAEIMALMAAARQLRLPRGFAPRRYQRRTPGWGRAIEHLPGLRHQRHRRPPTQRATCACDLVSHHLEGAFLPGSHQVSTTMIVPRRQALSSSHTPPEPTTSSPTRGFRSDGYRRDLSAA